MSDYGDFECDDDAAFYSSGEKAEEDYDGMEPVVESFDGAAGGGGHAWGTNLDDAKSTVCFLRSVAAYHHVVALLHTDGVSQRVFLSKQRLEVIAPRRGEDGRRVPRIFPLRPGVDLAVRAEWDPGGSLLLR